MENFIFFSGYKNSIQLVWLIGLVTTKKKFCWKFSFFFFDPVCYVTIFIWYNGHHYHYNFVSNDHLYDDYLFAVFDSIINASTGWNKWNDNHDNHGIDNDIETKWIIINNGFIIYINLFHIDNDVVHNIYGLIIIKFSKLFHRLID